MWGLGLKRAVFDMGTGRDSIGAQPGDGLTLLGGLGGVLALQERLLQATGGCWFCGSSSRLLDGEEQEGMEGG